MVMKVPDPKRRPSADEVYAGEIKKMDDRRLAQESVMKLEQIRRHVDRIALILTAFAVLGLVVAGVAILMEIGRASTDFEGSNPSLNPSLTFLGERRVTQGMGGQ